MDVSRIFVRGLPLDISSDEFEKHFSRIGATTDSKLIPRRRFGYVGFKTSEEARKAVKYFDKSFVRASKIRVELAQPANSLKAESHAKDEEAKLTLDPKVARSDGTRRDASTLTSKRKYDDFRERPVGAKLQEFLDVMKPSSGVNGSADFGKINALPDQDVLEIQEVRSAEPGSFNDTDRATTSNEQTVVDFTSETSSALQGALLESGNRDVASSNSHAIVSDADWQRSRTRRVLDLVEPEGEEQADSGARETPLVEDKPRTRPTPGNAAAQNSVHTFPGPSSTESEHVVQHDSPSEDLPPKPAEVWENGRLFLRNLGYDVSEKALEENFSSFGTLEEVSELQFCLVGLFRDANQIGTTDAQHMLLLQRAFSRCIFSLKTNLVLGEIGGIESKEYADITRFMSLSIQRRANRRALPTYNSRSKLQQQTHSRN